ncbi:MAG: ATP-binding cassette domain-containing protein [Verrucomicrobiota bacterium]|nr:ATP-binding cassette domain-containing protein [Verrucomicrobiota bacterium]
MSPTKSPSPVSVDVRGVRKSYAGHEVLHDVTFTVQPGEIFVIMGPSGSGKSVLLRQIIGLERPDGGEILIAGLNASAESTHAKIRTGLVFQSGALFNSLSVFDNCAFYLKEHRLYDKATIRDKVMEALRMLSLENAAHKSPAELSGGMKKRVAVARALVMEPQLLLYDEPTSELDPIMAATVAELIATVREETHLTSIVVSHDRDVALTIGDRVALLMNGTIKALDKPSAIRASKDPVVCSFLNPQIDLNNPRFRKE